MLRETLLLGLSVGWIATLAVGCTQGQSTAQKPYYHDRKVVVGSNIPRSYSDDSLSTTSSQNEMTPTSALEFQQMQRTSGNEVGGFH